MGAFMRGLALLALVATSGCMESTAPATRSGDGEARKFKPGMSQNDAFAAFGPESGFERNPADWDEVCLSYAYGPAEAPSYVHARFRGDVLISATDGHAGLCIYDAVAPAT